MDCLVMCQPRRPDLPPALAIPVASMSLVVDSVVVVLAAIIVMVLVAVFAAVANPPIANLVPILRNAQPSIALRTMKLSGW